MLKKLIGGPHDGEEVDIFNDAHVWFMPPKQKPYIMFIELDEIQPQAPPIPDRYYQVRAQIFNKVYEFFVFDDGLFDPEQLLSTWFDSNM